MTPWQLTDGGSEWVADTRSRRWDIEHLDGIDWYAAGKRIPKWRKRLPHQHRAQTRGWLSDGFYIERCVCGAYGPKPWTRSP